MKKIAFLILSAMVILLSGCTGANHRLLGITGDGRALARTNKPASLHDDNVRGLCLPISNRSSLNIDVECILDYVQGESSLDPEQPQHDVMDPWIRVNYSF